MKLVFSRVLASNQADRQGNKQSQVMVVTMSRPPAIRGVCVCVSRRGRREGREGKRGKQREEFVKYLPCLRMLFSPQVMCPYVNMGTSFLFFFQKNLIHHMSLEGALEAITPQKGYK